ncbi:PEP-CTERM sorting domain-containing protein [Pseudoduganella rivuli]|nr:PEP-CTERM sorting domain-containing protein [Pseudoduganella rivuli]
MPYVSRLSVVAVFLCGTACAAAAAPPRYRVTILDTMHGEAVAINNAGDIAGNLWDSLGNGRAVGWFGGSKQVLPALFESATSISSKGHIGGYSTTYSDGGGLFSSSSGLVYYRGNTTGVPEAFSIGDADAPWYTYSRVIGVNGAGWVLAHGAANSGSGPYLAGGGSVNILPLVSAYAINDQGQVAGWGYNAQAQAEAMLYAGGQVTGLGTLPGDRYSAAMDVNENGVAVGFTESLDASGYTHKRSFIYMNGQMTALGNLASDNTAVALNNLGMVLGYSSVQSSSGTMRIPYLYQDGAQYDLGSLVTDPNWHVADVSDINDSGMIVGQACNLAGCYAALLTPVPEPAAYAMLLAGLGWLGWRRPLPLRTAVR